MPRLATIGREGRHLASLGSSGTDRRVAATVLVSMAVLLTGMLPAVALASTPTTTTLDVPTGTQFGPFTVTAHVRPTPQTTDGFIPAVEFYVGGVMNATAPLDESGDASTELSRPLGTYEIFAKFGPFHEWDASESAPGSVRVGVETEVSLSSSRNPALDSQSLTIEASVTPASVSGGTLSIVDAFDGSTIATGTVGPGTSSVSVSRTFAAGNHTLTASYSGDGDYGPSETQLGQKVRVDSAVDATGVGVGHRTFYPYRDGYLDSNTIRGTLREPSRVLIRIYSPSDDLITTVNLGSLASGRYEHEWRGRSSSGSILAEGTYRVVQRLTDRAGNSRTVSSPVVVSRKRLVWTTTTLERQGSGYDGIADTGSGTVSANRSAYHGGVRLSSGKSGVAVNYKFNLHSALAYGDTVKFRVLGRSPNRTRVLEGLWDPAPCSPAQVSCYDTKSMGPGYGWWSIGGGPRNISGGRAYGAVIVPYDGTVRTFDIAVVRLVYSWAVLGY